MYISVPDCLSCEHFRRLVAGRSIIGAIRDDSGHFFPFGKSEASIHIILVAIRYVSGGNVTVRGIVVAVRGNLHMTRSANRFVVCQMIICPVRDRLFGILSSSGRFAIDHVRIFWVRNGHMRKCRLSWKKLWKKCR